MPRWPKKPTGAPDAPDETERRMETPSELNFVKLKAELDQLRDLLLAKRLQETQLHKLFKRSEQLSLFMKCYHAGIHTPDFMRHEFKLLGRYRCDLVVGDSKSRNFCLIEFEDAQPHSVFHHSQWSPRFEHGFGQLVDWSFLIDGQEQLPLCKQAFDGIVNDVSLVLVIGRDKDLTEIEMDRLRWRSKKVVINSRRVYSITYDQLYAELSNLYDAHAAAVTSLYDDASKKHITRHKIIIEDGMKIIPEELSPLSSLRGEGSASGAGRG